MFILSICLHITIFNKVKTCIYIKVFTFVKKKYLYDK